MRRSPFVTRNGTFVPRVLIDPWPDDDPKVCGACGGLGSVPETIDEERYDVLVPCEWCQRYCKTCKEYVPKEGHECPIAAPSDSPKA